jgi:hypothetical protein
MNILKRPIVTIFYPGHGGSRFLFNHGNCLPDYRGHIPKDSNLHSHCHENLNADIITVVVSSSSGNNNNNHNNPQVLEWMSVACTV